MSRIPAEDSTAFSSWLMPEVKDGQVVQVEKIKKRGPKGELINVDKNEVIYNSITAGQLEEISNQAYEELREQAYKDGFQQGHTEGYQKGMDGAQQQLQQQSQSLKETLAQFSDYLGGQDDEVEQALVNVATCIAKAVIRRELTIDSSHILEVVSEAVAELPLEASNLTVYLSKQDHELLENHADVPESWQLKLDETISSGGCRVTTRHSVVDFTLEEQFQETINALVESRFAQLAVQAKQRAENLGNDAKGNLDKDSINHSDKEG